MPTFAIIGTVEIAPGRMDEFLPLLMAHRARCLKDEPGTLQFEVLMPYDDNTKVMVYGHTSGVSNPNQFPTSRA